MAFRYWCGECGYKTAWLGESEGAEQQLQHYAKQHPDIPPGGRVEVDRRGRPSGGLGCLAVLGVTMLLLVLAASCHR